MLNPQQVQQYLQEVEQTQTRSEQYLRYWRSGVIVQLWGVVWFCAYLGSYLAPAHSGYCWLIADAAGMLGTAYLLSRQKTASQPGDRRIWLAMAILVAFGIMVSTFIVHRPGAISVFWTSLFMLVYMLAGLWYGLRWTILGASICVLTFIVYHFLAPWFDLAMALLAGGGLLLGGTWLRRAA